MVAIGREWCGMVRLRQTHGVDPRDGSGADHTCFDTPDTQGADDWSEDDGAWRAEPGTAPARCLCVLPIAGGQ
jgi:hypothetical protein